MKSDNETEEIKPSKKTKPSNLISNDIASALKATESFYFSTDGEEHVSFLESLGYHKISGATFVFDGEASALTVGSWLLSSDNNPREGFRLIRSEGSAFLFRKL